MSNWGSNDQKRPLDKVETLEQTLGCRHSNPDICRNNMTPKKCAFVRDDNLCMMPPRSWKKLFSQLKEQEE